MANDEMVMNDVSLTLVEWYNHNKRDLPWRKTKDPYCIWISEIMLQQTQVSTVIPYYQNFLSHFPTVSDLAKANIDDIYKCWEGLGYYSRARNLKQASLQIINDYQGSFPSDKEELLKLKGIGPYTASAISSIAFEKEEGVVDGNVLRIISRLYNREDNIALEKTKKDYQQIVNSLIKGVLPSAFNQGLMDLGATICTPKKPDCNNCPLNKQCLSYKNNTQNRLPVNIKKIKHTDSSFITCIIEYDNEYFLIKNEEGLLQNLYGLVQYEVESIYSFEEIFEHTYHQKIEVVEFIKDIKHVFSHKTWYMHVYLARFTQKPDLPLIKDIDEVAISTAHKKCFDAYYKYK